MPPRSTCCASQELGEHTGLPQNRYRWRVAMARIREAEGDLDGALDLLDEAERLYVGDFSPNVRPVAALRARVWVAQGRLGEALGWARERGLSVEDDLSYLREFEHITLARVLLARYASDRAERSFDEAIGLLERLLRAAEEGERTGSVIEILVLQALAHQARGDIPAALVPLERALTLAEPEGYVRIFVDEGPPMAALLRAAAKRGIAPSYVRRLLAAFGQTEDSAPANQGLIEPLSERELDVLRLLGNRPGRPGHRPRARGVPEHRADPHQEHLRQARREQPPGSGPPGRGTRPAVAQPLTTAAPPPTITTSITTCGDARSPHLAPTLPIRTNETTAHDERDRRIGETVDRGRTVRDPPQGAPRCPMGRLVRRNEPHPRERRHHRHPRPGRRPGRAAWPAPESARPGPAAGLGHSGRPDSPTYPPSHLDTCSPIHAKETDMTTTVRTTATKRVPMTSMRKTAFVAGALLPDHLRASIPALLLLAPVLNNPDYILGSGADTRVLFGGFLDLVTALAGIGTAVALFSGGQAAARRPRARLRHHPHLRSRHHRRSASSASCRS